MAPGTRIIVNTLVQYMKAVITTFISLYSVRVVLEALTKSDYGLFMAIAGVVTMLGFITNSLIVTTQRYISVLHGKGNMDNVRLLYQNSMLLHLIIGLLMVAFLSLLEPWLVGRVLTIPDDRMETATGVYFVMTIVLFLTVINAPLKALFIARENITFIAIVEVVDSLLKLCVALSLLALSADRLLVYSWALAGVQALNFFAFLIYAIRYFPECTLRFRRADVDWKIVRQLTDFAGWTTYGMGAVAARAQGIAVLLNHFFGTVINAAYGIALQLYMGVSIVVTSVFNAMNPQIMKAEGEGDRRRMLLMAGRESKYSLSLMLIVTIPIMLEQEGILALWLKDVPENTVVFCRFILISFLFDLLTLGLNTAVQAIGRMKEYTLIMYTPKLLTLPIAWVILEFTGNVVAVMWVYILIELLMAIVRLIYTHLNYSLDIGEYTRFVFLPALGLTSIMLIVGVGCMQLPASAARIGLTFVGCGLTGMLFAWHVCLHESERQHILSLVRKVLNR